MGKVVRLEEEILSSISGRSDSMADERARDLALMGKRFPPMEQREAKKTIRKDNVERRSGEKRGRRRVGKDDTSIPVDRRFRDMGVEEWAWVGGLPDSNANRRGRRRGLWGPGSESKNVSEKVLGG